jgi:catechol 2,3-dioxygenase-like lactoylglutathione lyase family enzyme
VPGVDKVDRGEGANWNRCGQLRDTEIREKTSPMSVLDHIAISVSNYERSKAFYIQALAPLGIGVILEYKGENGTTCGFGRNKPDFWIGAGLASFQKPEHVTLITPAHIAFSAPDRALVDAFYEAALAAGGTDFGPPGIRSLYHPNYYGAFVLDPDGHNVEAVCHA